MMPVILRALFLVLCLAANSLAQNAATGQKPPANPKVAAEPDRTAFGALALLPKDVAARVARIEGPDGRPFPERWYVLVHDAAAPRGLREFVVTDGKALANRTLSQFADSLA